MSRNVINVSSECILYFILYLVLFHKRGVKSCVLYSNYNVPYYWLFFYTAESGLLTLHISNWADTQLSTMKSAAGFLPRYFLQKARFSSSARSLSSGPDQVELKLFNLKYLHLELYISDTYI